MNKVVISTLGELEEQLAKYDNGDYIFRGQNNHYVDINGNVNIPSSFSRHGCIPPLMFKWSHYSRAIIRAFGGGNYHAISIEQSQAILQHYGWRSFFVDLTKKPSIACWFASNKYKEIYKISMCEDFEENPVWLIHKEANYVKSSNQFGHVYIIEIAKLKKAGVDIYDLSETIDKKSQIRPQVQAAWLAGTLKGALPSEAIAAHFEIDQKVINDFCTKYSLVNVDDIFPSREKDFILKALLDLPWKKTLHNDPIPSYRRGLDIPEYDFRFIKHLHPKVTLYKEYWIAENRGNSNSLFQNVPFYRMPEEVYYANTDKRFSLREVTKLLRQYKIIILELDGLINIPELRGNYEFEKGVVIELINAHIVCVSGLILEHPGHLVSGVGVNNGWFYRINGSYWDKQQHADQCTCNNFLRHELQFSLLRILNEALLNNQFETIDYLNYKYKHISKNSLET